MGRTPCCDESGLKKGPWTPEEDQKLIKYIQKHGHGSWRALPKLAGLNRCGKSCRLRWTNYLRPDIKRGKFSAEEEQTILNLHSVLGNKWSAIASHLPGRTDNEIKNFWNTHLKKKLIQMGFDPMTHRPRTDIFASLPHLLALLDHQSLEEYALRLQVQADAMARLQYLQYLLQPALPGSLPQQPPNPSSSSFSDIEAMKLVNSLAMQENPALTNSPNPLPDNIVQPPSLESSPSNCAFQETLLPFTHMPDLQVPCSFQTGVNKEEVIPAPEFSVFSQGENSPNSPWQPHSSSTPSPPPHPPLPAATIDQTATTTYGGAATPSIWSDDLNFQLEDFHDIA